jgi:hypothetical protein
MPLWRASHALDLWASATIPLFFCLLLVNSQAAISMQFFLQFSLFWTIMQVWGGGNVVIEHYVVFDCGEFFHWCRLCTAELQQHSVWHPWRMKTNMTFPRLWRLWRFFFLLLFPALFLQCFLSAFWTLLASVLCSGYLHCGHSYHFCHQKYPRRTVMWNFSLLIQH